MQVIVRNGALIFRHSDYSPILEVMPHAKVFEYKGVMLCAVKHTLDAARILNNFGIAAPSPAKTEYSFPGLFKPTAKQLATVEAFLLNDRLYCLNEMRTGKTAAALWAADYLINIGKAKRVLVVSPLSIIRDVWVNEAFKVLPHRSCNELIGDKDRRIAVSNDNATIDIINFDGLRSLFHKEYYPDKKKVKRKWSDLEDKYDIIIVDEASAYCTHTTQRWEALQQLIKPSTAVWLLTGTPIRNAPTDVFGLIKLIQPAKLPPSFALFEETLMVRRGPYKKIPKRGAIETVYELMQPAVRFKRDQNDSLPTTIQNRSCVMSAKQQKAFTEMKEKMRYIGDDDQKISAANAAVRLIKIQQIMAGIVKDDEENAIHLDPKDRLDTMLSVIKEAKGKAVVYVPFIPMMEHIKGFLDSKGISCTIVNGTLTKPERDKRIAAFKDKVGPDVLIAHPKVMAYGFDLTIADTFIWYCPIFSVEQFEQANARGEGPNKEHPVGIYQIGCNAVEWGIYDVLDRKANMQDSLLDLYDAALSGA